VHEGLMFTSVRGSGHEKSLFRPKKAHNSLLLHLSRYIQSGNKEGRKEEYPINGQVKNLVLRCFFIFEPCKSNYNVHCLVLLLIQRCLHHIYKLN